MRIIVYVLLACQAAVIYYWISDWRQLVTPVGLFIWGGAIAVSLAVLRMGRSISPRWRGMLKMMTAGVSLLAVVSLLIEWATRSMP